MCTQGHLLSNIIAKHSAVFILYYDPAVHYDDGGGGSSQTKVAAWLRSTAVF